MNLSLRVLKIRSFLLFSLVLFLNSCGYHFDGTSPITISVPYVIGDQEGQLTDALIYAISRSPDFRFTKGPSDWTVKAKIKNSFNERIGFRYDRDPRSGKLRDNVIGTENRRTITV